MGLAAVAGISRGRNMGLGMVAAAAAGAGMVPAEVADITTIRARTPSRWQVMRARAHGKLRPHLHLITNRTGKIAEVGA